MKFGRPRSSEPEINLIPFIDVLLVVLIFLMLSTTYGRLTQIDLKLPTADSAQQQEKPNEIRVIVSSDGRYMIQKNRLTVLTYKPLVRLWLQLPRKRPTPWW